MYAAGGRLKSANAKNKDLALPPLPKEPLALLLIIFMRYVSRVASSNGEPVLKGVEE